jgi:hypothetical protein
MGKEIKLYILYGIIFLILIAKVIFVDKQPITKTNVYTESNDIVNDTIKNYTTDTIHKTKDTIKLTGEDLIKLNSYRKKKIRYELTFNNSYGEKNKRTNSKRSS